MVEHLTVVLVESTYLLRAGIENLLGELPGLVLKEVFDGTEKQLPDKVLAFKPDLVIVNCNIGRQSLFALVNALHGGQGIIQIGLVDETTPLNIRSRFQHLLHTGQGKFELLEALRKIVGRRPEKNEAGSDQQNLSARELTVLKKVALGHTNQEIANELFLSIHTVMTHRKNITKKLGIKTVSGLTVYALMNKLVGMEEVEREKE